jgi:hypothetical protein
MPNPHILGSLNVPGINQTANLGELVWNIKLGGGEDTEFRRTDSGHVWRISWAQMRQRIIDAEHPEFLPHDIAMWIRDLTDGHMPHTVAEQAVPAITIWLNQNSPYLTYEREHPTG